VAGEVGGNDNDSGDDGAISGTRTWEEMAGDAGEMESLGLRVRLVRLIGGGG
jgi:hypothetical protein